MGYFTLLFEWLVYLVRTGDCRGIAAIKLIKPFTLVCSKSIISRPRFVLSRQEKCSGFSTLTHCLLDIWLLSLYFFFPKRSRTERKDQGVCFKRLGYSPLFWHHLYCHLGNMFWASIYLSRNEKINNCWGFLFQSFWFLNLFSWCHILHCIQYMCQLSLVH